MEPITTAISTVAGKPSPEVQKQTETFLMAVLGEPMKELGGLLKDQIAARRFRNLTKIVPKAMEQLAACGLTPKEISLKVIHPLLEAASLEDDEKLQAKWSSLLANAANPESGVH